MAYIEREKLINELECLPEQGELSYLGVYDCVNTIPAAEVVEVRHGHWERGWSDGDIYAYCTACKRRMDYHCYGYAYCSLCGAKMDGKDGI